MSLQSVSEPMPLSSEVRICNDPECKVTKLLAVRNKSKPGCIFMTSARLSDKALVIDNKATAFQITGALASFADIKANADGQKRQLYRIKNNTHGHIYNVISVDQSKVVQEDKSKQVKDHRIKADFKLQALMSNNGAKLSACRVVKRQQVKQADLKTIETSDKTLAPKSFISPIKDKIITKVGDKPKNVTNRSINVMPVFNPSPQMAQPKTFVKSQPQSLPYLKNYQTTSNTFPKVSSISMQQGNPIKTLTQCVYPTIPVSKHPTSISAVAPLKKESVATTSSDIIKIQDELECLRRTVAKLAAKTKSQ